MAEFPALPLFTDAFIGDTTHLNAAQTGGYLMLMMIAWRTADCALPDDDQKLARWARMEPRAWKHNKAAIMEFWVLGTDGKWRQARLSDERGYVEAKSKVNSQAARARWLKNKDSDNANASFTQCERNAPTPTPSKKEEKDKPFLPPAPQKSAGVKMTFLSIPEDWKKDALEEMGWAENVLLDVWENFREFYQNGNGKKTKREKWVSSWRTWYRKENIKPSGGNYAANQRDNAGNTRSWREEGDRLAAKYRAEEAEVQQGGYGDDAGQNMLPAAGIWENEE